MQTKTPQPLAVADGVYQLSTGPGPITFHVSLVRAGPGWVLGDAGWTRTPTP
ncbi:hypothetical protein [Arthrobacter sp. AL12]|uniref:hypothetical protein n=1 Tax=Arthrobacter sp. AL12 TaxID=3042241 RepID=UPI00249B0F51|nr:hypothetical protein [Arthrobacter sp. AL12]MDI3211946.1 hypothetical protein [Arthrobacter sp. AL12]